MKIYKIFLPWVSFFQYQLVLKTLIDWGLIYFHLLTKKKRNLCVICKNLLEMIICKRYYLLGSEQIVSIWRRRCNCHCVSAVIRGFCRQDRVRRATPQPPKQSDRCQSAACFPHCGQVCSPPSPYSLCSRPDNTRTVNNLSARNIDVTFGWKICRFVKFVRIWRIPYTEVKF